MAITFEPLQQLLVESNNIWMFLPPRSKHSGIGAFQRYRRKIMIKLVLLIYYNCQCTISCFTTLPLTRRHFKAITISLQVNRLKQFDFLWYSRLTYHKKIQLHRSVCFIVSFWGGISRFLWLSAYWQFTILVSQSGHLNAFSRIVGPAIVQLSQFGA